MATASPPTIGGTASAIAAAVSRRSPLSRRAAPASARNSPAGGLAHTVASASRAASASIAGRRRCASAQSHARAPSAMPRTNGTRPMSTFVMTPAAKSHPTRRGKRSWRRAITVSAATATTPATNPSARGPSSAASGPKSSE